MIKSRWQYVPVAILILLLISEVVWYSPLISLQKGSFSILDISQRSGETGTNMTITYRLGAGLPMDSTVVITPVSEIPQDLPVYVFYDTEYPTVGTDWIFSAMLQTHLEAQLKLKGYSGRARLTSAEELEGILAGKKRAVVVMASGAFPSSILSKERNLVTPWLSSGGILIWFGFYIGYYVVEKGMKKEEVTDTLPQNLRENGSRELGLEGFFEYSEAKDNPEVATYSSPVSDALEVTYDLIIQAPLASKVWAKDGLIIGKIGGENPLRFRPSISMVPMGLGKIIFFGFFLMQSLTSNGPEVASWDVSQILCSGILQMGLSSNLWHQNYRLVRGETKIDTANLTVGSEVAGFVVLEYTTTRSDGVLFYRGFIDKTGERLLTVGSEPGFSFPLHVCTEPFDVGSEPVLESDSRFKPQNKP